MTRPQALLLCLFGVMVLSPDALLIRLSGTHEFTVLVWRGIMQSAVILTALFLWRGTALFSDIRAGGWRGVAYAVLFGFTASGFVYATSNTTVANTLFIVATSPIWAALMGWAFLGERISRGLAVTIVMVMIGMGFIAAGSVGGAGTLHGDLAALLCAVGLALTLTIARSVPVSLVPMTGLGGVAILSVGLLFGGAAIPAPEAWPYLLAMGLIVVPISFSLITLAARALPPSDSSLILLLEAPFGIAIVWAILGERPGPLALAGGVIVLITLAISNVMRAR
ncbi:MAG: DMT family transporter [Pseudomonadota bacterium]